MLIRYMRDTSLGHYAMVLSHPAEEMVLISRQKEHEIACRTTNNNIVSSLITTDARLPKKTAL